MNFIFFPLTADQKENSFNYLKSAFAALDSLVGYFIVENYK
jgi:hypothetical protein